MGLGSRICDEASAHAGRRHKDRLAATQIFCSTRDACHGGRNVEVAPIRHNDDVQEMVQRQLNTQLAAARFRKEAAMVVQGTACPQMHEDTLVRCELQPAAVVVEALSRDIVGRRPFRVVLW